MRIVFSLSQTSVMVLMTVTSLLVNSSIGQSDLTTSTTFAAASRGSGLLKNSLSATQSHPAGQNPTDSLEQWIKDLDAADFETRNRATQKLLATDPAATIALVKAAVDPEASLERRTRCLKVLERWSRSEDPQEIAARVKEIQRFSKQPVEKGTIDAMTLRTIRRYFLLDLTLTPELALRNLRKAGLEVQETNGIILVRPGTWVPGQNRRELKYMQALAKPIHLFATVELLSAISTDLPKLSVTRLHLIRHDPKGRFRFGGGISPELPLEIVRQFPKMKQLEMLQLNWTSLTSKSFAELTKCSNLYSLQLPTNVTDNDLLSIGKLTGLRELYFHNAFSVHGDGLTHLRKLKNLERISLFYTNISGKHLKSLVGLQKLKWIYAPQIRMDDEGIKSLVQLKNLEELELDNTRVTNNGLKLLAGHPRLKSLRLVSGSFSDAGILNLVAKRSALRSISVGGCVVTKAVQEKSKAIGATFEVTGSFFQPNEKTDYVVIEKLLQAGLLIAQYPNPNNVTFEYFDSKYTGKPEALLRLNDLKKISTVRLSIFGAMREKNLQTLLSLPAVFNVGLKENPFDPDSVLDPAVRQKLLDRFN